MPGKLNVNHRPSRPPWRWSCDCLKPIGLLLLAALLLALPGCGGGEESARPDPFAKWGGLGKEEYLRRKKEKEAAEAREEAEAKKKAEAAKERKEQEAAERAKKKEKEKPDPDTLGTTGKPKAEPKEELPPLPAAVADWKEIDFLVARISDDPMLIPAVNYLGTHRVGDEDAAKLLGRLLQPRILAELRDKFAGAGRSTSRRGSSKNSLLIEAAVGALGSNGTGAARQVLTQLVTGELETEDDRAAATAALKALVEHPSPENETLLFQLLTAPDEVRLPGRGGITSAQLRAQALALLAPTASAAFRTKVARFLVEGKAPGPLRPSLISLVTDAHPSNLEAQVILYRDGIGLDEVASEALEAHFLDYSSQALRELLRLDEGHTAGNSELSSRVMQRLWKAEFQTLLGERLHRLGTLAEGTHATSLAGTIPFDAMRSQLYQTLGRHWHEGPAAFDSSLPSEDVVYDPGLMPLLARFLRDTAAETPRSSYRLTANQLDEITEVLEAKREVEQAWEDATLQVLRTLCRHFRTASGVGGVGGANRHALDALADSGLSDMIHPDANVVAVYQLDWPSAAHPAGAYGSSDAMSVRYLHMERKVEPSRLLGFFRRRLKSYEEREIDDGVWLDSIRTVPGSQRQQSTDVLVTWAVPGHLVLDDEERYVAIDALFVEVADFRPLPAGSGGR